MNIDFDPTVDHYKVLGVDPKASTTEIKKAYRKLAKEFHPDSTGGDKKKETRFKEVSSAYEILGDEKKRAQYDEVREAIRSGRYRRGPMAGGPRPGPGGPQVWDLSDLFGQFFTGQAGQAQGAGPGGVRFEVEDWPFGEAGPRARRQARRDRRRGEGTPEPPVDRKARASDGSWLTVKGADVHSDVRLPFQDAILGTVREIATIDGTSSVKIPPGTSSGQKLRLRGKGVAGPSGQGDHYVTVHIDVPKDLDEDARKKLVELVTHLKHAAKKSR
jgi:DnaJ-class molecular chaperone